MPIINPQTIVAIVDSQDDKVTSIVLCKIPAGFDKKGNPVFRHERHLMARREADQLAHLLLKKDKEADNLREGLKPGPRIKV